MKSIIGHIRQSLSLKLSFGVLLIAMFIFVVATTVIYLQSSRRIRQEAMEGAASALNTASQRVQHYLSTVETATNANDWLMTESLQPESLLACSRRIVQMNVNVNGCSVTARPGLFARYGRYFSAYSVRQGDSIVTARESEYEYFEKPWYSIPERFGRACWVDPFDDYTEGTLSATEIIASYCKPLYDAGGQFVGVVATDVSFARVAEAIATEKPYPNAYFLLLGKDGHCFACSDTARMASGAVFDEADVPSCLVSYWPVPNTTWRLVLVCPDSDILQRYNRLGYLVAPPIAIGLLLILLLCRSIVSQAIRPLNQLVEQSQRIAAGHYDEHIARSRRQDAVGRLQNSFATMQQSLDRHISDIRQANSEAVARNEELLRASRLAEEAGRQKTAFIQNMTHQIRTPLNIIMGFAQVLCDGLRDMPEEEVKSVMAMMQHNAMTLNRMVLMLYDGSDTGLSEELGSERLEEVSCNEVARESIVHTSRNFPGLPVDFQTTLSDDSSIYTNRLYLMRSLRELLYNSAKYSDGQHISLHVSQGDGTVRFVFQDTGPGIDESHQELIFQLFTKVNDLSEGLGLGLPLAKRHITNLGGTIRLDTDYRDGCRFVVELPAG